MTISGLGPSLVGGLLFSCAALPGAGPGRILTSWSRCRRWPRRTGVAPIGKAGLADVPSLRRRRRRSRVPGLRHRPSSRRRDSGVRAAGRNRGTEVARERRPFLARRGAARRFAAELCGRRNVRAYHSGPAVARGGPARTRARTLAGLAQAGPCWPFPTRKADDVVHPEAAGAAARRGAVAEAGPAPDADTAVTAPRRAARAPRGAGSRRQALPECPCTQERP